MMIDGIVMIRKKMEQIIGNGLNEENRDEE